MTRAAITHINEGSFQQLRSINDRLVRNRLALPGLAMVVLQFVIAF
jgi:hypothetical protein